MKLKLTSFAAVMAVLMLSSCSTRLVDFTIISSKNHSLNLDKTKGERVVANDNGFLGIGTSIKDAMDKALQSVGPEYDLLVDGVVKYNSYFFVSGYKVEGTAVSSGQLRSELGEEGFKKWCRNHDIFNPATATVESEDEPGIN